MRKRSTGSKTGTKFFSGIFILLAVGILVWIGISIGKEAYRKKQIQSEIDGLQADIGKYQKQNSDLENLVSYLSTDQYKEKEARDKLNLQKEDEKMIVLQKGAEATQSTPSSQQMAPNSSAADSSPNWKKWLSFFFASKS